MNTTECTRERVARSRLISKGYRLNKAPARHWTRNEFGVGYQILRGNQVVAGCCQREFEMDLKEVEDFVAALVCERAKQIDEIACEILKDEAVSKLTGQPRKYKLTPAYTDLLPNGKTLGDCTGAELELVGQAYSKVASLPVGS